jgi:hypothetical protein
VIVVEGFAGEPKGECIDEVRHALQNRGALLGDVSIISALLGSTLLPGEGGIFSERKLLLIQRVRLDPPLKLARNALALPKSVIPRTLTSVPGKSFPGENLRVCCRPPFAGPGRNDPARDLIHNQDLLT